jgi:hypothetical protein
LRRQGQAQVQVQVQKQQPNAGFLTLIGSASQDKGEGH